METVALKPGPEAKQLWVEDPETGCHVHMGWKSWTGYGRLTRDGKAVWAHRWAWEQENGPIPAGMMLDHLCRNKACVNPSHLEVVTNAENQRRGTASRLSWEDVEYIRTSYVPRDPNFGQRALARLFGVTHAAIQKVLNHVSWVDGPELVGGQ
jgi:hypothetical protein